MKVLPKIDIHVHAVPEIMIRRQTGDAFPLPSMVRKMYDEHNIEKGVLLPDGANPPGAEDILSPREAWKMVKEYPETFGWWYVQLSPCVSDNSPNTDLSYYLNQYKQFGCRGVGELSENRYFDDPYMLNLYKHCELCDMPIVFHVGNMGGDYGLVDDLGFPRLEKVLGMFPKLKFFGHSQKFWAEIAPCTLEERNGYPTGKVAPGGRIPELLRKYPNLCGDLSAGSGCNAIMRDPEFGYQFLEEFQDQLYFGTDICSTDDFDNDMLDLSTFLDDAMLKGKISYAAYEKISRGNALNLLEK